MMVILFILTLCLLTLSLIGLYLKSINGICKSKKRLDGKTCLLTGGTSGIGLEIAIDLAMRGARLILPCPFKEEGENAKKKIIEESGNEKVELKFMDLTSFESVREFAADVMKNEERLDILINNAGVGVPVRVTDDGFNIIMQVNYLGHFLLTILLLPLLKKTGTSTEPSRILNTSSITHRFSSLDIHEIKRCDTTYCFYRRVLFYSKSKLCLLLFSRELSKKLVGSNVVINDADPGEVGTRIYLSAGILGVPLYLFCIICSKNPFEGAQTTLHAALDHKAGQVSGKFFRDCRQCKPAPAACDDVTARGLWEESVACVKLSQKELQNCLT